MFLVPSSSFLIQNIAARLMRRWMKQFFMDTSSHQKHIIFSTRKQKNIEEIYYATFDDKYIKTFQKDVN